MKKKFTKRISAMVSMMLCVSMFIGSTGTVLAEEPSVQKPDVVVKYVTKDGEVQDSNLPLEFFEQLSQYGESNIGNNMPSVVPDPGDTSIRIGNVVRRKESFDSLKVVASIVAGAVFNSVWAKLGGKLIKAGIGTKILNNKWLGSILDSAVGYMVGNAYENLQGNIYVYEECYQYKAWSNYYNCYLVYQVVTTFDDPSYSNVLNCVYWNIYSETGEEVAIN